MWSSGCDGLRQREYIILIYYGVVSLLVWLIVNGTVEITFMGWKSYVHHDASAVLLHFKARSDSTPSKAEIGLWG
jgi:hypothetical protein